MDPKPYAERFAMTNIRKTADQTAIAIDFEFQLGRDRLMGSGWRGLAALACVLTFRAVVLIGLASAAGTGISCITRFAISYLN